MNLNRSWRRILCSQGPEVGKKVILAIFGSPDRRQIDGLGGADSLTSKLAIIAPSKRPDSDVDYTFGAVDLTQPIIDFRGNCGNISSGVGPFAIDEGLVEVKSSETMIRIFNTNTKKNIKSQVIDGLEYPLPLFLQVRILN
ncbi:MAG: hypothetical protein FJ115_01990 [Deltaproteobacteria bacterium]|nr:hypothetical protein [Deltaproteobacteria bacterium]